MASIPSSIWFEGPIGEAVSRVNTRNCLLFVYIYDDSPQSNQLSTTLEDPNVSAQLAEQTVALKLEKDSDNAKLFSQLYPTYHIPIVYFIKQGIIKDFGTEEITPEAIIAKLDTLSQLPSPAPTPLSTPTPTTPTPASITATAPSAAPSAAPLAAPSAAPSAAPLAAPSAAPLPNAAIDTQKQEKIRRQIEEARKRREEKEKREAHERELKRREDGKTNQQTKESLEDKQTKAYFDKLRKEKKEEEEHRKRVKEQIARDRADKAASKQTKPKATVETPEYKPKPRQSSDQSKLSIRQLDGSTLRNTFQATDKLSNVQGWIDEHRSDGDQPYKLLAQFPTRQFSIGDEERSLAELDLCPSGTIIMKAIKNVSHAYAPAAGGGLMDYVYSATGTIYQAAGAVGTTISSALGSLFPAEPGNTTGYTNPYQQGGGQRLGGPSATHNPSSPSTVNTLRSTDSANRETYNGNSVNQE